jgi:hypothetical protein
MEMTFISKELCMSINNFNTFVSFFMMATMPITTTLLQAAPPPSPNYICARNFIPNPYNIDPCDEMPSTFQRVKPALTPGKILCTKIYAESFCAQSPKEFKHVVTTKNEIVCTVNFYEENGADYCTSTPEEFQWAIGAP